MKIACCDDTKTDLDILVNYCKRYDSEFQICTYSAAKDMLDAYPSLQKMYAADDGNTQVFYFKNATATISAFTHEPEVIKF